MVNERLTLLLTGLITHHIDFDVRFNINAKAITAVVHSIERFKKVAIIAEIVSMNIIIDELDDLVIVEIKNDI